MLKSKTLPLDKAKEVIYKYGAITRRHNEPEPPIDDFEAAQECAPLVGEEIVQGYEGIVLRDALYKGKLIFGEMRIELENMR